MLSSIDSMCATHLIQFLSEAAPKAHKLAHIKTRFLSGYWEPNKQRAASKSTLQLEQQSGQTLLEFTLLSLSSFVVNINESFPQF